MSRIIPTCLRRTASYATLPVMCKPNNIVNQLLTNLNCYFLKVTEYN